MPLKICQRCGKEFKSATKRGNFCPGACYISHIRDYGRQHRATFSHDRLRAISLTQSAIVRGDLKRQPCEVCGKITQWDSIAHHDDYTKPLEIRWLCRSHHKLHHVKHGPGLNAFRAIEIV